MIPQNDWVCENNEKPSQIEMVFWSGNIVGFLVWGYTNDRYLNNYFYLFIYLLSYLFVWILVCLFINTFIYFRYGRRPTIVISHIVYTIGNVLTFVFTDFPSILICRFLVGTAHMTISHLPYMLGKCSIQYLSIA